MLMFFVAFMLSCSSASIMFIARAAMVEWGADKRQSNPSSLQTARRGAPPFMLSSLLLLLFFLTALVIFSAYFSKICSSLGLLGLKAPFLWKATHSPFYCNTTCHIPEHQIKICVCSPFGMPGEVKTIETPFLLRFMIRLSRGLNLCLMVHHIPCLWAIVH